MEGQPAVILCDMDGVLVDSEALHWESVHDVLLALGVISSTERLPERIGWGDEALWTELKRRYQLSESPTALTELRAERAERRLCEAPPPRIRGSREGLLALRARDPQLRFAVVSASPLKQMALSLLEYEGLFELMISGVDDCAENKPSPEPYLTAMARLAVEPARCWIFEDSPTGLRAALASGARVWRLKTAPDALIEASLTSAERAQLTALDSIEALLSLSSLS